MKKSSQEPLLFNVKKVLNNNNQVEIIKTTNVNILLNRVRYDKKKTFRKKAAFIMLLVLSMFFIGFITLY
jgi:hypothetical protein